ncbi:D-Ala-D-Ala carboxypeptidase family metallohydrolase [Bosea sp. Tri-44]|uniref:YcbK family protein n=1 Tax=Bosea sp. Tri-44 TaxID=1972137 RepID=UPI0013E9672E|nr:D-Ala-D-Ala carboxypeptidase family metallohydrolase [Bosea sp. Tri-44]
MLAGTCAAGMAFGHPAAAQMMLAPLPPERPFDLDLQIKPGAPPIVVVPAAPIEASAVSGPAPTLAQPDDDEGPEWPQRTPGQVGEEPAFDPDEKPDKPGISTDPGTSIVCLPPVLKAILGKISDKYGAVKVTSTWRPPWRARRGSYHKRCEAMDFRVPGVRPRVVLEWARNLPEVGGNKVYWNGLIHIDTGPRRPW